MATSGIATWNPDYGDIVETSHRRATGGTPPTSGWHFRAARFLLNELLSEWGNRGLNMWTIEEGSQALTAGLGDYTLPADTIDLIEHTIRYGTGSGQTDTNCERISVAQYSRIASKTTTGQPTQIFVQRVVPPVVHLWPLPDTVQDYTLIYWRLRRLQDAGSNASFNLDMPNRFIPAMIAGLAHKIAMETKGQEQRVPYLEQQYEKQWELAAGEDHDRTSYQFAPFID